jgi:hypothetical protein
VLCNAPRKGICAAGDCLIGARSTVVQWFPAVVCQPGVIGAAGHAEYLIEYENTKLGSQVVLEKHLRICHDFDWYKSARMHVERFVLARAVSVRVPVSTLGLRAVRVFRHTRLSLLQVQELGAYSPDRGDRS